MTDCRWLPSGGPPTEFLVAVRPFVCRVQLKCDGTQWHTEGKWRGNWRMEWVASTLHTTSEHGVSSITAADAHTSAASSRLNWHPCRFKWTRPFRRKTKSGFCACVITFRTQSTTSSSHSDFGTMWQISAPSGGAKWSTTISVTWSLPRKKISGPRLSFAKSDIYCKYRVAHEMSYHWWCT